MVRVPHPFAAGPLLLFPVLPHPTRRRCAPLSPIPFSPFPSSVQPYTNARTAHQAPSCLVVAARLHRATLILAPMAARGLMCAPIQLCHYSPCDYLFYRTYQTLPASMNL